MLLNAKKITGKRLTAWRGVSGNIPLWSSHATVLCVVEVWRLDASEGSGLLTMGATVGAGGDVYGDDAFWSCFIWSWIVVLSGSIMSALEGSSSSVSQKVPKTLFKWKCQGLKPATWHRSCASQEVKGPLNPCYLKSFRLEIPGTTCRARAQPPVCFQGVPISQILSFKTSLTVVVPSPPPPEAPHFKNPGNLSSVRAERWPLWQGQFGKGSSQQTFRVERLGMFNVTLLCIYIKSNVFKEYGCLFF